MCEGGWLLRQGPANYKTLVDIRVNTFFVHITKKQRKLVISPVRAYYFRTREEARRMKRELFREFDATFHVTHIC